MQASLTAIILYVHSASREAESNCEQASDESDTHDERVFRCWLGELFECTAS